jgi:hypothetical protein
VITAWLTYVGVPQYSDQFLAAGFFNLDVIKTMDSIDLDIVGISDMLHRDKILAASKVIDTEYLPSLQTPRLTTPKEDHLTPPLQRRTS